MTRSPVKNIILLLLMLLAATLGAALRPNIKLADERAPINLESMVPTSFAEWREANNHSSQVVNPQQKAMLDQIYSQILTRTYVNQQGYRIMLSIAYGKNQSDSLQLHMPELCYPAQGFSLLNKQHTTLDLLGKPVSARLLLTNLGQRFEPVTYWTIVGDHIASDGTSKKLIEMQYAFSGRIPDGMLIRISSIDKDTNNAYLLQRQFASAMVNAIAPEHRTRFVGVHAAN